MRHYWYIKIPPQYRLNIITYILQNKTTQKSNLRTNKFEKREQTNRTINNIFACTVQYCREKLNAGIKKKEKKKKNIKIQ